jgi:hypothetical protein
LLFKPICCESFRDTLAVGTFPVLAPLRFALEVTNANFETDDCAELCIDELRWSIVRRPRILSP